MNDLEKFLKDHRPQYGTLQNLANDIEITYSGLLRAKKAGKLSVKNCLLLAAALGAEPPAVLRASKEPELADLLERLYGKTTDPMPSEDRRHLDAWRELSEDAQEMVRAQMQYLPKRQTTGKKQSSEQVALKKRARSG